MSDRDRSSPSLTDTPLKTYIGRHDDDYPLINGNGECFLSYSPEGSRAAERGGARPQCSGLSARHALEARGLGAPRAGALGHWVSGVARRARCSLPAPRSSVNCGSPHTISFAALKLPPFDRPAPLWPLPEKHELTYSLR